METSSPFWTNTIWFLMLGALIEAQIVIILRINKNRVSILLLFCAIVGLTFLFETSIMSIFTSYKYYPKIIPWSEYDDSVMGNFFSQLLISGSAFLLATLHVKKYWYVIVAIAYGAIEILFVNLGIYEQFWYRTWITVVVLPGIFWLVDWIYKSSYDQPIKKFKKYVLIFFGLATLHLNLLWILRLLDIFKFSKDFLPQNIVSFIESIIPGGRIYDQGALLAGSYDNLLSILCLFIYYIKINWKWKAVMLAVLFIPHYFLVQSGLYIYPKGMFIFVTALSVFGMYFFVYILEKGYSRQSITAFR